MRSKPFFERLIDNWPAKIISLGVALVLFLFYRIVNLDDRYITVPLQYDVPSNYTVAGDYPRRVRVTLRGKEEELLQVLDDDIHASVDLSDYTGEGTYKEAVQVSTTGTALKVETLELTVEPLSVTVKLERKLRKSLDVSPSLVGFPAKGFELSQYFITPSTVDVEGPESIISDMENISTENIDLADKKDNFTLRVPLNIRENINLLSGENVVEFHGIVQERVILKTFSEVPVIALDLSPELQIINPVESGFIQVQGLQNFLEEIEPGQLTLVVDCSEIEFPGTYTLEVDPEVLLGLLVLNYGPQEISLTIGPETGGTE